MRSTERVVDIEILAGNEALHESRIIRRLAGIESQVVQKFHPRSELRQTAAHRFHGVLRIRSTLRSTEMGAGRDGGTTTGEPLDRGERGTDAEIVNDLAVGDRDVEVGAQQDSPTIDVAEVLEGGNAHGSVTTWRP